MKQNFKSECNEIAGVEYQTFLKYVYVIPLGRVELGIQSPKIRLSE